MSQDMREMVREILSQELAKLAPSQSRTTQPQARVESVSINSDGDLQTFVRRILNISNDQQARAELQSGRLVFRLDNASHRSESRGYVSNSHSPPVAAGLASKPGQGASVRIDQGLITERQIRNLPDGTSILEVTQYARITPLATDAARQTGITIKKVKL